MANRMVEHRSVECKRMEFAVFAAGIDALRQIRQQLPVEPAPRTRPIELTRIDAGEPRLQPALDHVAGEIGGRLGLPDGKERRESRARQPVLAVSPHILAKTIAE